MPRRLPQRNRDSHSVPSAADAGATELPEAVGRVQQVRQARDAKRLEIHVQQHESMLKEEHRQGTEEARKHRYVDSPLVTGKPKVDRETGRIPLVQPMAQRTATLGSDPVGSPRYTGAMHGLLVLAALLCVSRTMLDVSLYRRSRQWYFPGCPTRATEAPATTGDAQA